MKKTLLPPISTIMPHVPTPFSRRLIAIYDKSVTGILVTVSECVAETNNYVLL